jgi:sialate O-acetylesterase
MISAHRKIAIALGALLSSIAPGALRAEVKVPSIVGDHMVLQQETPLPVWGTADPGEKVTVTVDGQTASTTAGAGGKWRIDLSPLAPTPLPVTMTIAGKNKLVFDNVLVGEVWLTSGQSNMEFSLHYMQTGAADAALAADRQLRLFQVARKPGLDPRTDFAVGQWAVSSPAAAEKFSALSYYFGRNLRAALNRPVGIISTASGGTPAEAWISLDSLQKNPAFQRFVDKYEKTVAAFPEATAEYPARQAAYQAELGKWQKEVGVTFNPLMTAWLDDVKKARLSHQHEPPRPVPPRPQPKPPVPPAGDLHTPTAMFNGNIAPVIPYTIRGAVWYQGESNGPSANQYRDLLSTLIAGWRDKWGQGDFPFLFVQLPKFEPGLNWPLIRDQQLKTLSMPKTGMAVAIDVGDPSDVHPLNKIVVAERLALLARHLAYGQDLVWSGPMYDSMKIEGPAIRLRFTHVHGGLVIGAAPWVAPGADPLPADRLAVFAIAGADQKWFPADARIDGNTVLVSSPQVHHPVAVRLGELPPLQPLQQGWPARPDLPHRRLG